MVVVLLRGLRGSLIFSLIRRDVLRWCFGVYVTRNRSNLSFPIWVGFEVGHLFI